MAVESTRNYPRENSRSTRNRSYRNPRFNRFFYEHKSWIRDTRSTSIRNKCHMFSIFQEFDNPINFLKTRMRVKREKSSSILDIIISEELSCNTGIFTSNIVSLFQYSHSSQSYIFEISDGRRNDREHSDFLGYFDYRREKKKATEKVSFFGYRIVYGVFYIFSSEDQLLSMQQEDDQLFVYLGEYILLFSRLFRSHRYRQEEILYCLIHKKYIHEGDRFENF